jgi:tetratricopeptide (TPR) repeat protein
MPPDQFYQIIKLVRSGNAVKALNSMLESHEGRLDTVEFWRSLAFVYSEGGFYTVSELAAHCGLLFFPEDAELVDFLRDARLCFFGDADKSSPLLPKAPNHLVTTLPAPSKEAGPTLWQKSEYLEVEQLRAHFGDLNLAGQHEAAEEECREALHLHPDFPQLRADLAIFLARAGRVDEAMEIYPSAALAKPCSGLTFWVAKALVEAGRKVDAISILEEEVACGWPNTPAARLLQRLYLSKGRVFSALRVSLGSVPKMLQRARAEAGVMEAFRQAVRTATGPAKPPAQAPTPTPTIMPISSNQPASKLTATMPPDEPQVSPPPPEPPR